MDRMGRMSWMVDEYTRAIKELDVVVITQDVPEHGLMSGDVGTVVHCYGDGEAYEVEVVAANGHTVALLTFDATSVRLRQGWEISHVREHEPVREGEEVGGYYPRPREPNEASRKRARVHVRGYGNLHGNARKAGIRFRYSVRRRRLTTKRGRHSGPYGAWFAGKRTRVA